MPNLPKNQFFQGSTKHWLMVLIPEKTLISVQTEKMFFLLSFTSIFLLFQLFTAKNLKKTIFQSEFAVPSTQMLVKIYNN